MRRINDPNLNREESTHCFDAEIYVEDQTCSMNIYSISFWDIDICDLKWPMILSDVELKEPSTRITLFPFPFLYKNIKESENADLTIKKMLTQLICCD